jgi:quercetin dioxygenase-like cupin family protein
MAHAGDVIQGPRTKILFRQTARDTAGALLQLEQWVQPKAPATPAHLHPRQTERFRVVSGVMGVRAGGQARTLRAGEEITVAPGVPHAMWNAGDEPLHQVIELLPALRSEMFFETIVGLERDGKMPVGRPPNLLQFALILREYENPLASPPLLVQRPILATLAAVGRLVGYRSWYPAYSVHGPVEQQ